MRAVRVPLTLLALLALAAPCAAASGASRQPDQPARQAAGPKERVEQEDRDQDGRKETTVYYSGSTIRRVEVDKNGDGQTDQWVDFEAGKRSKGEADTDYDGRPDAWFVYNRDGALRFAMKDTNGDGRPDEFKTMVKGRDLVLREMDTNHDGKIDKRRLMKWGMVRSIPSQPAIPSYINVMREEDLDFDGIIDVHSERAEKGQKPKPSRQGKPMKTEPNYPMPEEEAAASGSSAPAGGSRVAADGSSIDPSTGKLRPGEAAGGRWRSGADLAKEMNERYGLE